METGRGNRQKQAEAEHKLATKLAHTALEAPGGWRELLSLETPGKWTAGQIPPAPGSYRLKTSVGDGLLTTSHPPTLTTSGGRCDTHRALGDALDGAGEGGGAEVLQDLVAACDDRGQSHRGAGEGECKSEDAMILCTKSGYLRQNPDCSIV